MSNIKKSERYTIIVATLLFFAAFGAIAVMDRPHGDIGEEIDQQMVRTSVDLDQGSIEDPSLPEGLLIFGAGQSASLDFEVENNDPDNDIDTIEISIPGSTITNGTYEWYTSTEHDWTHSAADDTVTYEAVDDFEGQVSGESSQYDVAGNVDDALDHGDGVSEMITLNVEFNVTDTSGMKMGEDAIDLKAGDLKTEDPGAPLTSVAPFPFPYIVADNGDKFMVITLDNEKLDLEVMYGDEQLFSPSRAGNFMTSQYGFKYNTTEGNTVVVLQQPSDKMVTPLIKAKEAGLTGTFTLEMFNFTVDDIEAGTMSTSSIVSGYTGNVPDTTDTILDTDMDDDGILNQNDVDMDGDGINNTEDQFPETFNRVPVVEEISEDVTMVEGEVLDLSVTASDPDEENLEYLWTRDDDDMWNSKGSSVSIEDLEPGTYTFSVAITDELGNVKTRSVTVTVEENQAPGITSASASSTSITEGDEVTLTVEASDPEGDELTYTWTNDQDTGFSRSGSEITVADLTEGSYVFTVTVSDGMSETTDTVQVDVEKDDDGGNTTLIIIIVIAVLIVIVAVVVFFMMKKSGADDEEDLGLEEPSPEEPPMDQQEAAYGAETPEEGYQEPMVPETSEMEYPEEQPQPPAQEEAVGTGVPGYEAQEAQQEAPQQVEEESAAEQEMVDNNCPECGAELGPDDTKCPGCGAEFDVELECPTCGEIVPGDASKCPTCGMEF